ncbi:nitrite/sulfite reductase [Gordonia sp. NB41Y]|nr:nitrite/sulfite reductase [Gordonia sp. NB41Y]WLP93075.1 nitrite/sulfite reductase [Gordonia sp. NB41Y]
MGRVRLARGRPRRTVTRTRRDEGQWAVGGQVPLNDAEQIKADDDGLNVRARIEEIYSERGWASIEKTDLRNRFRWWGLYTQRRPGIDGGKTATLDIADLEDEYFMLRVRVDGGRLSTEQLRTIADVSTEFARDTADISDRQNIQLHWIRVEDLPEIWRRLEGVGLTTGESAGDTPRVILGSPLAGIAADEVLDGTPALTALRDLLLANPEYSNLPRKFKTAVSGLQDVAHEIQDVAFIGVDHPEHGPGFDVWVGGGLSTNPMLAVRLGAWVPSEDVPEVWAGIVSVFRDYGYRRVRTRARLRFLVADWGAQRFRDVLETEYLGRTLADGPGPTRLARPRDHVGVQPQKNGLNAIGAAPTAGRSSGTQLRAVADAAETAGSHRVRLTPMQKLVVLDVDDDHVAQLTGEFDRIGLAVEPSPWRRSTMACTGIEYCKYGLVETKHRAAQLITELEQSLAGIAGELGTPISIHLNGCPNSCARIQVADIGLKGMRVAAPNGEIVDGFQVHLGGSLGFDAGMGRKLRGHKVLSSDLHDYVTRVVTHYLRERLPDETFATWVGRADEPKLR